MKAEESEGIGKNGLEKLRIQDIQTCFLRGMDTTGQATSEPSWSLVRVITDSGIDGMYVTKPWVGEEIRKRFAAERDKIIGASISEWYKIEKMWNGFPYMMNPANPSVLGTLEICMWDILGKSLSLPVYKLLGQKKSSILAYASIPTLGQRDEYVRLSEEIKKVGYKAIKIHPPQEVQKDIEICRAVRETVGESIVLMLDSVGVYNRREALKVGRELDELGFFWYEDPLPTTDIDGLQELCNQLDTEILIGERVTSITGFTEYIRRHATDAVRCSVEQLGGISSQLKVAHMAECFGMNCEPHSWGHVLFQAASLNTMLCMNNCNFFELPMTEGKQSVGMKDIIKIESDGHVLAPDKGGLGYEIDNAKVEELLVE